MTASVIKKLIIKKYPFAKNPSIPWGEFVTLAKEAATLYKFSPSVTVCQAALECGRGTSVMSKTKNNYFGFMAYDKDPGKARQYPTALDSIIDYLELITRSPRYQKAATYKYPLTIIKAIHQAGYATDPQYVEKITSLQEWKDIYK